MSTKTTFKRVALVAVAALGFGMLSVVPSTATARTAASIVVGAIPESRVGISSYVPVTVYLPSAAIAADTITINAEITSAPDLASTGNTSGAASVMRALGTIAGNDAGAYLGLTDTAGTLAFADSTEVHGRMSTTRSEGAGLGAGNYTGVVASKAPSYILQAADIAAGKKTFYVAVTPDKAGSYTVLVSTNAGTVGSYTAGDSSATFTMSTGTAPTAVVLTTLGGGTINTAAPFGTAVAVTLVGGSLSGLESINMSTSGSATIGVGTPGSPASYATTKALTYSSFVNGTAIVWLKDAATAAETISLTATGSGGISSSVTATKTFSVVLGAGSTAKILALEAPGADADYAAADAVEATDQITVTQLSTSQSVGFTTLAAMTAQTGYITVVDTAGKLTGVAGLKYDIATSFAATTLAAGGSFGFAANASGLAATTTLFTVTIPAGTADVMGLAAAKTKTFVTAAPTNDAITVTPNANILAAPAAAIALTATLVDQFGNARANVAVTVTTSGRNNPAASTKVTNADGEVTFTTGDSSTSTTSLVDTVTFSASPASKVVTINYANTAVGTVTVTGGNTTASVTAATVSANAISVGSSTAGAEAGVQAVTATVKDALGNALAGVPVTFTVAGTGAAVLSTKATVYTGATGTAASSIYGWVTGTYTYTVTAGTKTTTGTITFSSSTAGNARVVSAVVSGNVVTGKVVDRYGNPVSGVTLYASTTAPANIGGLFVSSSQTTAADGTISWVISGSGSVTVSAISPSAVAGTTSAQTCALAGNATCATVSTAAKAYTAATVGTATTAETNVGSTYAPAGVASASVSATDITASEATDAAAEATDAANAATDAANAAAEAADAATAAAQDAADAVAALSAQVATLISGLKAQLTALTNLVIKIQKKVKA